MDSYRSLHFRLEQAPEPIFKVRTGAGVDIKVCAGANQYFEKTPIQIFVMMLVVVICQTEWN